MVSSASFSTLGTRRLSTVALISSSYLRSRLAALSAAEDKGKGAESGAGSSVSFELGGRMFSDGLCLTLLLLLPEPEPKIDPLPEPNSALGKLLCRVLLGRGCCGWRSGEAL